MQPSGRHWEVSTFGMGQKQINGKTPELRMASGHHYREARLRANSMGEMSFNPSGYGVNSFQTYGTQAGKSSGATSFSGNGLTTSLTPKDEVSIKRQGLFGTPENHGVAGLENPGQTIRLAVAQDPRGGSLNPATLDMLRNPPNDSSGFGI